MNLETLKKGLNKIRFILYGVIAILFIGFISGFYIAWKFRPKITGYHKAIKPITVLKTRILYRTRTKYKTVYVPPEGYVKIKPKDPEKTLEDVVEVKIKWYGLTLKPGLQFGMLNIGYGLDFKLAYINRFGLNTGFLIIPNRQTHTITPSLGLSYRLDRLPLISNTEAQCAYTPLSLIPINCGLRISL